MCVARLWSRADRSAIACGYSANCDSSWRFICSEGALNTLGQRQNDRHFADDIFKCIFLNENTWISIKISLKFIPKGPVNNIPALVQIMAWRRLGDKPLSEPMVVRLPTHICVTRPEWVKTRWYRVTRKCFKQNKPVRTSAGSLLTGPLEINLTEFQSKQNNSRKLVWKYRL